MSWDFELVAGPYGNPIDGPTWDGEALLFTHLVFPANRIENRILRYDPDGNTVTDFRRWTHRTSGLAFSPSGTLYGCQSASRRLVRFNTDGSTSALSYKLGGQYHNQPKDLVIDSRGRIWFADPFGIGTQNPRFPFLDHASVLLMDSPPNRNSHISRMTYDTVAPSAVLVSQDERTLYVAENSDDKDGKRELRAYPILDDNTLGSYSLLHTFSRDHHGIHPGIRGMCMDTDGNIIASAGGSHNGPGPMIYVFSPMGRVIETAPVPDGEPTNCTFGDIDLRTLYVTTNGGNLYRVRNSGRKGWLLYPQPHE